MALICVVFLLASAFVRFSLWKFVSGLLHFLKGARDVGSDWDRLHLWLSYGLQRYLVANRGILCHTFIQIFLQWLITLCEKPLLAIQVLCRLWVCDGFLLHFWTYFLARRSLLLKRGRWEARIEKKFYKAFLNGWVALKSCCCFLL